MVDDLNAWIKVVHIVAVIAWMAGMLYLPRLFVYHAEAVVGSEKSEIFKVMEYRLLRFIINPAMLVAWVFGLLLVYRQNQYLDSWFHAKLTVVLLLSGFHGALSRWRKDFAADRNRHSARFYRIMNEVPTIMMILIVIFVIVKPF